MAPPDAAAAARPRARPRREQILAAARVVLERDGLADLTVLAVASAVPISEASVFYHFGSRDELLVELGAQLAAEEFDSVRRVIAEAPTGVDAMVEVLRHRHLHYENRIDALELVHLRALAALPDDARDRIVGMVNDIFDQLERRLEEDANAGRIESSPHFRARVRSLWVMSDGFQLMSHRVARGHLSLRLPIASAIEEACALVRETFRAPARRRRSHKR